MITYCGNCGEEFELPVQLGPNDFAFCTDCSTGEGSTVPGAVSGEIDGHDVIHIETIPPTLGGNRVQRGKFEVS